MKLSELFKTKLSAEDEAKLAGAQTTINALECERDTLKASLAARDMELSAAKESIGEHAVELNTARAEVETVKASVKATAAQLALEITGQQVTAPVPAEGKEGSTAEVVTAFSAITDPQKKAEFFKKNEAALRAAAMKI